MTDHEAGDHEAGVAVLVLTLNEALRIGPLLDALRTGGFNEIVVCDGGSTDGTDAMAASTPGVRLVRSERGRGAGINAAARASRSPIIIILHADTLLPPRAAQIAEETLIDPLVVAGCFRLRFDARSLLLDGYAWLTRFDSGLTTFGDQAYFIRRTAFEAAGGAPDWPLLEDVALRTRLRRLGRFVKLREQVVTSARRFVRRGSLRGQVRNAMVLAGYHLGVPIRLLAAFYEKGLSNDVASDRAET